MGLIYFMLRPWVWLFTLRFTPDDFRLDPEGFVANQSGHIALGVWLAMSTSGLWLAITGDLPRRDGIWVIIAVTYIMIPEILVQGWRGLDTLEDWCFVTVYGSGGALFCFHEVNPGSGRIYASLSEILIVSIAPICHLLIGAAIRARRRLRAERKCKNA